MDDLACPSKFLKADRQKTYWNPLHSKDNIWVSLISYIREPRGAAALNIKLSYCREFQFQSYLPYDEDSAQCRTFILLF